MEVVALRLACLVGLAVSAMLLVDYIRPPVFCADHGSGCSVVRSSVFARPFGIPLPLPGLAFFAALFGLTLTNAPRAWLGLRAAGALGVFAGGSFLLIQHFVIHAWCQFCVVVDLSRPGPAPGQPAPLVNNRVPDSILAEQREGVATIVEFVDFECPFCRRQQEAVAQVVASYGPRVRVVRKNVPLSFHPHARDAARAACCAEEQGRGDAVAEALFRAEDLTPEGCERVAQAAGVDLQAYRACLASPRPNVALERDDRAARDAGVSGLPTLWVGREQFVGLQTVETLRASIDRALRNSPRRGT
jgi:protein-disulfide isomerase/uncharacterized membrane protein